MARDGSTRRTRSHSRGEARVHRRAAHGVLALAAVCLMACAGNGTAGILMEAATAALPATAGGQTSFTSIAFQQTYNFAPLVFVLPTTEGGGPCDVRIRNVTTTGFELAQVEPNSLDGSHGAMTLAYFAIEPGTAVLPDGSVFHAGSISTTTTVQHSPPFGSAGGFDSVTFPGFFTVAPSLLAQVQTMNNEAGAPPGAASTPWLTAAVQNITSSGAQLSLERAEVNDGSSVTVPESIGYVAITPGASSFFDGVNSILYDASITPDTITGWDDAGGGGSGVNVAFNQTFSAPPLVVGNLAKRDGADGGWLRSGTLTAGSVRLTVDEDQFTDSERNHTDEAASLLAFSQGFRYEAQAWQPGIVAHWPFDDGAGGTAADIVGGHTGTLTNGPAWTTDTPPTTFANPSALSFDGSNDYVVATGYTGVTGTSARTAAAWIRTSSTADDEIISWGNNSPGEKWILRIQNDNGVTGAIRIEVNGGYLVGSSILGDNQWHHVAVVLPDDGSPDVTECLLYVDGKLEPISASQARAINTSNANVRIGVGHGGYEFGGLMDDVRIYAYALGLAEVQALAARAPLAAPTSYSQGVLNDGPFAYWRLNEPGGTTAVNLGSIGAQLDGTYAGNVTQGVPGLVIMEPDAAARFNRSSSNARVDIPDHNLLNAGGPYVAKTVELWFRADDVTSRQALYEQGGGTNGLNIYVENDRLYVGAWNQGAAPNWTEFLSVGIEADVRYMVDLVMSGDISGTAGTLELYLNGGLEADTGGIGFLPAHTGDSAIGAVINDSRYFTATGSVSFTGNGWWFGGVIDEVSLYNLALSREQIALHYRLGAIPEPATLGLVGIGLLGLLRRRRRGHGGA